MEKTGIRLDFDISIHAPPRGATIVDILEQRMEEISIHAPPRGATCIVHREGSGIVFQFTPLREGRHHSCHLPASPTHFNSRPSARGDLAPLGARRHGRNFNSRPSARGDSRMKCASCKRTLFQFTPLREGRRRRPPSGACPDCNFNSRPSARGDSFFAGQHPPDAGISIHAPPRGATCRNGGRSAHGLNFNSRPSARGDARQVHHHRRASEDFNSRPSARGDDPQKIQQAKDRLFQFTPLREGRREIFCRDAWRYLFQFTPLREGRPEVSTSVSKPSAFQFTPLREGRRRRPAWLRGPAPYFNSRPSARGDGCAAARFRRIGKFQFTPLREGRRRAAAAHHRQRNFNSRPSARGDVVMGREVVSYGISIHAPPRGATCSP